MIKSYHTIQDVLASPWVQQLGPRVSRQTDRVLRSTKLEDSIYSDLRSGDTDLDELERAAGQKLHSFSALSRDVYQSFYSLLPKRTAPEELSTAAKKFNSCILDHVTRSEDYPTLKSICEGRELPAYEAASEFINRTAGELDALLSDIGGKSGSLQTLEKLEQAEEKAREDLTALLDRMQSHKERNELLEKSIVDAANIAESKRKQAEAVGKLIDTAAAQHKESVAMLIAQAVFMDRTVSFDNMIAAVSADTQHVLGKFLYFSLPSILVDKEELVSLCDQLGLACSCSSRLPMVDAFKSATGDIRDRVTRVSDETQMIYQIYCRDNKGSGNVVSRELVKETKNRTTNRYEKLANIQYDKVDQVFG